MIDNQQSIPLCAGTTIADSLRATGFNNSAYALSELIDNSVEAGAHNIYICVFLDKDSSIAKIAVLDDGYGIEFSELHQCLQYGSGTHINIDKKKRGLGRFGVGLTHSTFSQCEKLDVWSWQEGVANSYKAFCHLPSKGAENQEPRIAHASLAAFPDDCKFLFSEFPEHKDKISGTLVLWDGIRNLTWKKYKTLFKHIEMEVGRIFRKFINDEELNIRMIARDLENANTIDSISVRALDPLFLQKFDDNDDRVEDKFRGKVAFEVLGPELQTNEDESVKHTNIYVIDEESFRSGVPDNQANVRIYVTHRKEEIVKLCPGQDPGNTDLGSLASKLQGVSITRLGRELQLDNSWMKEGGDTTDRWIGICVDFDPSLDEIFDVSNNKQNAHHLSKLANKSLRDLNREYREENSVVHAIAIIIKEQIRKCRQKIKKQREGERGAKTPKTDLDLYRDLETGVKRRREDGNEIDNDVEVPGKNVVKLKNVFSAYVSEKEAGESVDWLDKEKFRVEFMDSDRVGSANIFKPILCGGVHCIVLNETHPMYTQLDSCISPDEDLSDKEKERLQQAGNVIKKLIFAYARAEAEATGNKKDDFESVRLEWGRVAKDFFTEEE